MRAWRPNILVACSLAVMCACAQATSGGSSSSSTGGTTSSSGGATSMAQGSSSSSGSSSGGTSQGTSTMGSSGVRPSSTSAVESSSSVTWTWPADGGMADVDAGPMAECEGVTIPAGPRATRLLTRREYNNTIRDLLGDTTNPADSFPAENQALGFENNADNHTMNALLLEQGLYAAEAVAQRAVTDNLNLLLPCDPVVVGEGICGEFFVHNFGRLAFRRPLETAEEDALVTLFHAVKTDLGFNAAIGQVIQVILQSPRFLYRVEGAPDGVTTGIYQVPGYEMASRLSYFLWATMPDEALFNAAANGELSTRAQVEAQARRMVMDGRSRAMVRNFFRQWLRLDTLKTLVKNTTVFPLYQDAMRASWQEAVYRFVDHVYWEGTGTLDELLTSSAYYVDASLASLYGQPAPASGFVLVEDPAHRGSGLLSQPGMMALLAKSNQTSPILRGIFVRDRLMCEGLQQPPANANLQPPAPDPDATTRERFAQHTRNPSCQACHILIDTIGFGLENYDALGRWRDLENGLPVDANGEILQTDDPALQGAFTGAAAMSSKLAASETVQRCIVRQHFRSAMGRGDEQLDTCTVSQLTRAFRASGGNLRELLVQVAVHDAFRTADATGVEGAMP